MRASHITYIKSLIESIRNLELEEPTPLIPATKVFEVDPPLDQFQESVPFVVIKHVPTLPKKDGRRIDRLPNVDIDSKKHLEFLKREYEMEFRYSLNFWFNDPTKEVLSSGNITTSELGILDQSLIYLVENERYLGASGETIHVEPGRCSLVTDPAGELGLYKIYIEVIFKDGLFRVDQVPTLANGQFELEEPTEIEVLD
jgi:hypothetical protein